MPQSIRILIVFIAAWHGLAAAAAGTEVSFTAVTERGLRVELCSQLTPLAINRMHSWQIRLLDSADKPVSDAEVSVQGGMPEHDHGLPTSPVVSPTGTPGTYLLQGMRFHMPGQWQLSVTIDHAGHRETTVVEFSL